jgi:hypothetical protein
MLPNFDEMTVKQLVAFAEENNIDLEGNKKKADIIALLKSKTNKNNEEGSEMEEQNVNVNVNETENTEVVNEGTENTEVNEGATPEVENTPETGKDEKKVYHLEDGSECSRSAYIRQEFAKDRSRKEIKDELGVAYYIVYAATANMYNAKHPEGATTVAGKGSVLVAKVNSDFKYVDAEGNTTHKVDVEGQEVEVDYTADEVPQVPRAELMRELAEAGKTRSEIKDYFQVPYATVYAATKDSIEGEGRTNKKLIHPVTGKEISRADYIRELYATGKSRRDIAKELTILTGDLVDYSTVWAATKPEKADEEEKKADETAVPADVETTENSEVVENSEVTENQEQ